MKPVTMLPNLLTLANAGCGLLAISKAIDALAVAPEHFERKLESACWLIFIAMVFDMLDGRVARLMQSFSDFGAELDSLADLLTFGVAPALLTKVLLEREGALHPRLHFFAAACFALMAILRLARFNLETVHQAEAHASFKGLPSPAAAGTVAATILMYLALGGTIEQAEGTPTAVGKGLSFVPEGLRSAAALVLISALAFLLPILGLLMVSRIRYPHLASILFGSRGRFANLVGLVFMGMLFYVAPVPLLFFTGWSFVFYGLVRTLRSRRDAKIL